MRAMGLRGAVRGKTVKTTVQDPAAPCPLDRVRRQFHAPAPDRLWVSDFTYVATWQGFAHVAFVIDAYARRIVGWRVSRSATANFVLDALEQAIHQRQPAKGTGLIAHSDRGSQYLAIRYTERLAEAGIEPSVGSVGDAFDNALAETVIGLFKTEVIRRRGPWRSLEAVEFATLEPKVRAQQRMGGLVQPPPAPRPDRSHPARRGRGAPPRAAGGCRDGGVERQTKSPPANPGRFTTPWLPLRPALSTQPAGRPVGARRPHPQPGLFGRGSPTRATRLPRRSQRRRRDAATAARIVGTGAPP